MREGDDGDMEDKYCKGTSVSLVFTIAVLTVVIVIPSSEYSMAQISLLPQDSLPSFELPSDSSITSQPSPEMNQSDIVTTNQSTGLSTYENKAYGFSIEYPSDWQIPEKPKGFSVSGFPYYGTATVVAFVGPYGTPMSEEHTYFTITVTDVEQELDTNTLQVKSQDLDDIVQNSMDFIDSMNSPASSLYSPGMSHEIIKTESLIVGGVPAKQIQHMQRTSLIGDTFKQDTYLVNGDKLYTFLFSTGELQVPETLPIANMMLDSFKINNSSSTS
jgi:PsbP-like protein